MVTDLKKMSNNHRAKEDEKEDTNNYTYKYY